jgi:glycosyltransferase involved in cell wall biosynthesis
MDPDLTEQRNRRAERRVQQPKRKQSGKTTNRPTLEFPCVHRHSEPAGTLKCSCRNAPEVYRCNEPAIASGYCMPTVPKQSGDGPIALKNGTKTNEVYVPYALREGEQPRIHEIVCCSTCPIREAPHPNVLELQKLGVCGGRPDGTTDILHLANDQWADRIRMWARSTPEPLSGAFSTGLNDIPRAIELTQAKVIVSHRLTVPCSEMFEFVTNHPQVAFVNLFHGSINNLMFNPNWPASQLEFITAAQNARNVFYATPDERMPWESFGWQNCVHWPNLASCERLGVTPDLHKTPALLVSGRLDIIKALPVAIMAAGLVAKEREIRLFSVCPSNNPAIEALAGIAKVKIILKPWMEWTQFQRFLRDEVSLTIHPSLTDAFPHIPLDSLAAGRPVVGSSFIPYLPSEFTANPNNPSDVADCILKVLDDYDTYSQLSLDTAKAVHDRSERRFLELYERLIQ